MLDAHLQDTQPETLARLCAVTGIGLRDILLIPPTEAINKQYFTKGG